MPKIVVILGIENNMLPCFGGQLRLREIVCDTFSFDGRWVSVLADSSITRKQVVNVI